MKKVFFGMIIGAGLMFAAQAGAAGLVGSKVTSTNKVTLNGEVVGTAPIINGTSYLPVRTISNALDVQVVSVSGGTISLADQEMLEMEQQNKTLSAEFNRLNSGRFKLKQEINELTLNIGNLEKSITQEEEKIKTTGEELGSLFSKPMIEGWKKDILKYQTRLSEIQPQFDELDKQLTSFLADNPQFQESVNN